MISQILYFIANILTGILDLVSSNLESESAFGQIVQYPPIADFINFLKMISYIATAILLFLSVWIIIKFNQLKNKIKESAPINKEINITSENAGILTVRWAEISKHLASSNESEWKFAIIEADKLVDDALRAAGFGGETLGERLMNIQPGQIQTLGGLWEAHKVRNRLVHDTNYFLRYAEAKKVILLYEETLKELGAL